MTGQKFMVKSKYEKYEMPLVQAMQKGQINYVKLAIDFRKTQLKRNVTSRSM